MDFSGIIIVIVFGGAILSLVLFLVALCLNHPVDIAEPEDGIPVVL
jgi:NADH:ubiquinone oxidoreductase subunit 6 (subunit J)